MIRLVTLAAVIGVLVAAGGLSADIEFPWRSSIAAWLGAPDRRAEAKPPQEDWPICTTMGAMGTEADWAQLDPDFAAGKKALVAEDWNGAITALVRATFGYGLGSASSSMSAIEARPEDICSQ
jgi:hypothetical protein